MAVPSNDDIARKELRDLEDEEWLRAILRSGQGWQLVKSHHMPETAVAKIVGVTQAMVWLYLNGRCFPQRQKALRLARLLKKLQAIEDTSPSPLAPPVPSPSSGGVSTRATPERKSHDR